MIQACHHCKGPLTKNTPVLYDTDSDELYCGECYFDVFAAKYCSNCDTFNPPSNEKCFECIQKLE